MNYTAAPAAADDDNVFYDSGREGRKIAHYSTFRTCTFWCGTFQRPQCRLEEQVFILFFCSLCVVKLFSGWWDIRSIRKKLWYEHGNVAFIQGLKHKLVTAPCSPAERHPFNHYTEVRQQESALLGLQERDKQIHGENNSKVTTEEGLR